ATVALQYPDLAAEQLEDGVKKYGLRGAGIGGSVNGEEISDPKFDPFWAKAEQLGVLVFIHPQGSGVASEIPKRPKGNGRPGNLPAEGGVRRLMIGTDLPDPWTKPAVEHVLGTPGLSDADGVAILGGNAVNLLGIKTKRSPAPTSECRRAWCGACLAARAR